MYQNQTEKTINGTYYHYNTKLMFPFDIQPGDSIPSGQLVFYDNKWRAICGERSGLSLTRADFDKLTRI